MRILWEKDVLRLFFCNNRQCREIQVYGKNHNTHISPRPHTAQKDKDTPCFWAMTHMPTMRFPTIQQKYISLVSAIKNFLFCFNLSLKRVVNKYFFNFRFFMFYYLQLNFFKRTSPSFQQGEEQYSGSSARWSWSQDFWSHIQMS